MIGKTIANLRKARGLTQAKFAEEIHVTQAAVSQWETERTNPDVQQMFILANYFGITVEELSTGNILPKPKTETPPVEPNREQPEYTIMARGGYAMDRYHRLSLEDKQVVNDMINRLFELAFGKE